MRYLWFMLSCVWGLAQNPADLMATYQILYPTQVSGCILWCSSDFGCQSNTTGGACIDGTRVTKWLDKSSSQNNLGLTTSDSTKPIFRSPYLNGFPGVDFGPGSVTGLTNTFAIPLPSPYTMMAVVYPSNAVSGGGFVMTARVNPATPVISFNVASGPAMQFRGSTGGSAFDLPFQTNQAYVIIVSCDTNRSIWLVNGSKYRINPGFSCTNILTGLTVGCTPNQNTAGRLYGSLFEVALWNRYLNDSECYEISLGMKLKYGLIPPF